MATVNGDSVHHASDAFGGLGKRKRTLSQDLAESEGELIKVTGKKVQQSIEGILNLLRK